MQTRDVRVGMDIHPIAERVVNALTSKRLLLKEVVVVTKENPSKGTPLGDNSSDTLEIVHEYLLIYEVVNTS